MSFEPLGFECWPSMLRLNLKAGNIDIKPSFLLLKGTFLQVFDQIVI